MSAPGRRSLAGSVGKLRGVQTDGTSKGRLSLLSPVLGETDVSAPVRAKEWARERGRVRVAPSEWCRLEGSTPHLNPLPLAKGRGETNTMGPTTGEHYRIGLKSYSRALPARHH